MPTDQAQSGLETDVAVFEISALRWNPTSKQGYYYVCTFVILYPNLDRAYVVKTNLYQSRTENIIIPMIVVMKTIKI